MKGYPKSFKSMLYGVSLATLLTGVLLVPTFLDLRLELDVPWRLPFDMRLPVVAGHVIAALWLLMLFGASWTVHMRHGWRIRQNLGSGFSLVGGMLLLGLTGVGIYYFGDEDLSLWSSMGHTLIGIIAPLFLFYHISVGKLTARQRRTESFLKR